MREEPVEEREESFSTGPFSKETHWKQLVFLLKAPIELDRGASLTLCPLPGPRAHHCRYQTQYKQSLIHVTTALEHLLDPGCTR